MVVIAVSAMSIATSATYVITSSMRENMSERVITEDVWFNSATSISVYVHNVGKVDVNFARVYINNANTDFEELPALEVDRSYALTIEYNWTPGELYYIDIVTSRGLHIADYYQAP
ncbi:MAG: hypothetical protein ACBZ72_13365 [Candidatus Bathyarchaeia archaeon]